MSKKLNISFDSELIESISSDFDLRTPNKLALRELVYTLDGEYDPTVVQVMNLATGVGKTYLMAAFIEYLRRQGVGNVVIVTPGKTVQAKTVQNFTPGTHRYIAGAELPPDVVTPQNYSTWITRMNSDIRKGYSSDKPILAFIFNIQQLIAPNDIDGDTHGASQESERRKPRRFDESAGVLFDYLKNLDDLVVIADESHLYSSSAVAFNSALKELDPAAIIGLTASVLPEDHVIYRYPLYKAINDEFVKSPVLAFRKGGYGEDQASEEQQLRDALQLRALKQVYYDEYTNQNNLPHLNAVLFVVCSDVDHASQVAELLRSSEFFGKQLTVLQVDSKHDDDVTARMLENIDREDSPVLAVVSVNKLKEGWDVKNIAVVVTLRAMASEVLTQQTMGRGLRLPFKDYTRVKQIDQLDIISHQSFQELLEAENVLEQFGLEEAVSDNNRGSIKEQIRRIVVESKAENNGNQNTNVVNVISNTNTTQTGLAVNGESVIKGDDEDISSENETKPTIWIRSVEETSEDGNNASIDVTPIIVERNPAFIDVTYTFPVTSYELTQLKVDLSEIADNDIVNAAKRVTSSGDVLYRKEIIAALGKKLKTIDVESAEVDSIKIEESDAKAALVKLVVDMQMVPSTEGTVQYVENFLVPKFMKNVNFDGWTVKSLESASGQLFNLIKEFLSEVQRSVKEIPVIQPRKIDINGYEHSLNIGEKAYDPIEKSEEFVKGRTYSGWFKSLYELESFDSYSGEYELAKLLNTSPHIKWWHRLHAFYGAYIYYTAKDRYFPDFVAYDDQGTHWIIEGKDKRGRNDDIVQKKRKAAESLVRKLAAEKEYAGQNWGYLIAYEDDIGKADTWDDLKTLAQPVTNIV